MNHDIDATPGPTPGPGGPGGQEGPRVSTEELKDLGAMRRSVTDRKIAGVAAGVARHLDIDPTIVRVLMVVLAFFGGAGLIAYIALWVLLPEEGTTAQPLGLDHRNRGIAVAIAAGVAGLAVLGDASGALWFPWPLVIIAGIVFLVLNRSSSRTPWQSAGQQPVPPQYGAPEYGAPQYGAPQYGPPQYGPQPGVAPSGTSEVEQPQNPAPAPTPGVTDETAPLSSLGTQPPWAASASAPAPSAPAPSPAPAPPVVHYEQPMTWQQGQWQPAATATAPRPRRRGPLLIGWTFALIALVLGLIGAVQLVGGFDFPVALYPATALAITGGMLVLGSFWGRAGGHILLGLALLPVLLVGTVADQFDDEAHRMYLAPTSAAQVEDSYSQNAGEIVLDLRQVRDLEALDGRTITVQQDVGLVRVLLPETLSFHAEARVEGFGGFDLAGVDDGGIDLSGSRSMSNGTDPSIDLDLEVGVGQIEVVR